MLFRSRFSHRKHCTPAHILCRRLPQRSKRFPSPGISNPKCRQPPASLASHHHLGCPCLFRRNPKRKFGARQSCRFCHSQQRYPNRFRKRYSPNHRIKNLYRRQKSIFKLRRWKLTIAPNVTSPNSKPPIKNF